MNSNKLLTGYEITTDPDFMDFQNAMTPELKKHINKYHEIALKGKKSSIPMFLDAIEKYPHNPQLKNYLSVLYTNCGNLQKAYDTNRWILAEHPDYLFGKLNLAFEYYLKKEYSKMPEILGEAMEIKTLYPHRNKFHLIEVTSFFKCAILYYAAIGNMEQAEIRFEILEKIAPDSPDTKTALQTLMIARLAKSVDRMKEEEKKKIKVKGKKQEKGSKKEAPEFTHVEIEQLYKFGLYIEKETLVSILSLPRETLIKDLENVLDDSIERFEYFNEISQKDGWNEEIMNFVVHAIYILGELKAVESIDCIFKIFSQSDKYFDIYFGDFLTSAIWEPVYKIVNKQLDKCFQFMCLPGIDTFAKSVIPNVVEQIAHHQPERRKEVVDWHRDVIAFLLNSKLKDNVIDSDVIALMICNVIDIEAIELLPEIKKLFEKDIVSTGICGVYSAVEKAFQEPSNYSKKKEILPIADRYKEITSTWAGYNEDNEIARSTNDDYFNEINVPIRAELKIGRNYPCPCGSGRKYKKCCLNTKI